MRSWSIPVGRILGVELRLHTLFFILMGFSISYGIVTTENGARGFILWCLLLFAVAVREIARAIAALCLGLELRTLLLLPIGALPTYGVEESALPEDQQRLLRRMALVGPLANLAFGGVLAAIILAVSPTLDLRSIPWFSAAHLLKALVWSNLLLGAVNLLPAAPSTAKSSSNPSSAPKKPSTSTSSSPSPSSASE